MSKEDASLENQDTFPSYGTTNEPKSTKALQQCDDILKTTIGDFGRWQLKISLLMALLKFPIAWFSLSIVFLAPPTIFWCKPPAKYATLQDNEWLKKMVPDEKNSLKQEGLNSGYCVMKDIENGPENTLPCVDGYSYNTTVFHSSIVTEWDLVCGHQSLIDISQISLMLGILIGNIFFGIMADRSGRKLVLMMCISLQSVFGIIASWIPWYWGFVLARFLLAVCNGGTIVTSFVICMECVGGKWRTIVPILYQIPFGFGNTIMSGIAYALRDWRMFHFAISVLSGLYIFYIWFVPESPRWLIAVGRKDEAMAILQKAAIFNKKDPANVEMAMTELSNVPTEDNQKPSFSALFSTKQLKKRSTLLCLNWTICGITFFAFSQYLGHISGNLFFTVAVGGLITLPGTIFCVCLVARCGRRLTIAVAHLVTACCFLAILAVPKGAFVQDWPRVLFAGLGIIGLSVSMPALYLFTGELFPTVLRNAGVGASIMFSRIGSMVAPIIVSLQGLSNFLPLVVLTVAAFLEALLILPLPETKGMPLPETVEDLDRLE
ncbi:hypothetical protein NQ318_012952 [Aromia moschata]|uniref:Major facilitator superfamily (MFS) profile domain-containing protein n=1 Tax=Aromia moschata TaxID=1265417 RepID=A0AAV8XTB9_9CUCU|nr:hypothetical protein NQ318_012952 [Aromia moschata]